MQNTVFSFIAVAVSIAALTFAVVHQDPLGSKLSKYDFSTPENSLRSSLSMAADDDFMPLLLQAFKYQAAELRESIDSTKDVAETLVVHHEVPWGDRQVLFYSFIKDGAKKYNTATFKRIESLGEWTDISAKVKFDAIAASIDGKPNEVFAMIERWEKTGKLDR